MRDSLSTHDPREAGSSLSSIKEDTEVVRDLSQVAQRVSRAQPSSLGSGSCPECPRACTDPCEASGPQLCPRVPSAALAVNSYVDG